MKDDMSDKDILDERNRAIEYFTDIIDPIIDRHFAVVVYMPISKFSNLTGKTFNGGMKTKENNIYRFNDKMKYMTGRIDNLVSFSSGSFNYFMGSLKANPDIYYISYNQFALFRTQIMDLHDTYTAP